MLLLQIILILVLFLTFQLSFSAFCAIDLGVAPASMASANSLKTLAVMEASTVFTRDTFYTHKREGKERRGKESSEEQMN